MSQVNQKRIAVNTILLYGRMFLVLLVGLYTVNVIRDALGDNDIDIYGLIGSIVAMFSFLSNSMAGASQRYFAYELGRDDSTRLKNVYSLITTLFIVITIVLVVLIEIFGYLWLTNVAEIPADRMDAAKWVFHCAVVSFAITLMATPLRAVIIAHENMKVFAYMSILEVSLNLAVAIAISHTTYDRLVMYALLMIAAPFATTLLYYIYCRRHYKECRYSYYWNRELVKEITEYTGWNMFGSFASVCRSQGLNLILNGYPGSALLNAARFYAYKIYSALTQLIDNFYTATRPQIIKSYSAGETQSMLKLINQSSKFSFYLAFLIALPLLVETPYILEFWLEDELPEKTVIFTRLLLVNALLELFTYPIATGVQATGRVKWYQIFVGGTLLLLLPVAICIKRFTSLPAEYVFYASICITVLAHIGRLCFAKTILQLSVVQYIKAVILPILMVTVTSAVIPCIMVSYMNSCFVRFISVLAVCVLCTSVSVWILGMTASERSTIIESAKAFINRNRNSRNDNN